MHGAWLFGYGSLVSPTSVERTIGRLVEFPEQRIAADLQGYGRRWNYGSLNLRGNWTHGGAKVTDGVVVSLGLAAVEAESCNGVVLRVTEDELAALDWRERDYDRTDVTDRIRVDCDQPLDAPVVTYVPRPSAVERYRAARDAGRAAVRASYWTLVHESFALLGDDHLERFRATPAPDVPVADILLTSR